MTDAKVKRYRAAEKHIEALEAILVAKLAAIDAILTEDYTDDSKELAVLIADAKQAMGDFVVAGVAAKRLEIEADVTGVKL